MPFVQRELFQPYEREKRKTRADDSFVGLTVRAPRALPIAPLVTERFYRPPATKSWLERAEDARQRDVSTHIRTLDRKAPYVYGIWDQDLNRRFTRFCGVGSSTFVNSPFGAPKTRVATQPHRLFRLTRRVIY